MYKKSVQVRSFRTPESGGLFWRLAARANQNLIWKIQCRTVLEGSRMKRFQVAAFIKFRRFGFKRFERVKLKGLDSKVWALANRRLSCRFSCGLSVLRTSGTTGTKTHWTLKTDTKTAKHSDICQASLLEQVSVCCARYPMETALVICCGSTSEGFASSKVSLFESYQ